MLITNNQILKMSLYLKKLFTKRRLIIEDFSHIYPERYSLRKSVHVALVKQLYNEKVCMKFTLRLRFQYFNYFKNRQNKLMISTRRSNKVSKKVIILFSCRTKILYFDA